MRPFPPTRIESYSGFHAATCELRTPGTTMDLAVTLADATARGRRVTLRGAGLSFDAHALGSDLVVSLAALNGIDVDVPGRRVTAGAGARWRDVVAACLPHGLVPPVVVTTGEATVGGTLSANCHSRFSTTLGKEGRFVEHFELVTATGERLTCSRTENAELFHAVIGGFGLLGVVVRATYRLLHVGAPVRVETSVTRHGDLADLAGLTRPTGGDPDEPRAVYGLLALTGERTRLMMSTARLVAGRPLAPMLPHRPYSPVRLPIEWLIHWVAPFGQAFWNFAYDHYVREAPPYVDDLAGYTFMMEGHTRARRAAHRLGLPFRTVQTTFMLPGADPTTGATEQLSTFLPEALARLRAEGHGIALADVLWLPRDEAFGLSSTRDAGGYAVTLTFDAPGPTRMRRLDATLVELTGRCIDLGGRAHLGKNVHATPAQATRMYGRAAGELFGLKRRWDPGGTFGNALIDRLFPDAARPADKD